MALLTLLSAELAFGLHPLLDRANLTVVEGERIGLIGRNGTGKSSLLKVIAAEADLDDGEIRRQDGLRVTLVEQEPVLPPASSLRESLALRGHLETIHDERERWRTEARLVEYMHRFGLDEAAAPESASGGERKRAALALALAMKPDLLLLDEPTNHLDIDGIDLVEELLLKGPAAIVITHDRAFLDRVATRIVELDRGLLRSYPGNFAAYKARKAEELAAEEVANRKFDQFWKQEEVWIRKGVEARRTRDEGRVRRLERLRVERAERRDGWAQVKLSLDAGERCGKLVAELEDVSKSFGGRAIVRDLSLRVMRGDRLGVIGPNGAGKTTLLKLILGTLAPDRGTVRLGTKLVPAYFDQMRAQLDPEATLIDTITPGGEWVELAGGRKHVLSLPRRLPVPAAARQRAGEDALGRRAQPAAARAPLCAAGQPAGDGRADQRPRHRFAGAAGVDAAVVRRHAAAGEPRPRVPGQRRHADAGGRGRRALARVRRRLQRLGRAAGAGGDSRGAGGAAAGVGPAGTARRAGPRGRSPARRPRGRRRPARPRPRAATRVAWERAARAPGRPPVLAAKPARTRLSFKEQRELAGLPAELEALENEQHALTALMSTPDYHKRGADAIRADRQRAEAVEHLLAAKFERWAELEARAAPAGG